MDNFKYDDDLDFTESESLGVDKVNVKETIKAKGGPKGSPKATPKGAPKGAKPLNKQGDNNNKMLFMIGGAVVFIIVIIIIILVNNNNAKKQQQLLEQQQLEQQQQQMSQNNQNDSGVTTGIPNLYGQGEDVNSSGLTPVDELLTDLNGNKVDVNYSIREQKTVTDYINFVKHRSKTGNGTEIYWLEATYKKQPCIVQVPYSIYSKLDDEGITVVDVEVLVLEDGNEIVSYMSVRKDAQSLLDAN